MKLLNLEITNELPLEITLYSKTNFDEDGKQNICNRNDEFNSCGDCSLSWTEFDPVNDKNMVKETLKYAFDNFESIHGDRDKVISLYFDYKQKNKIAFDDVLEYILSLYPQLKSERHSLLGVPEGMTFNDCIATIEVAYPMDWNVKYSL